MISPDPSAVFRVLKDGGVILNVESGAYFEVNASGRFIWETLEDGVERNDIIKAMATNFDISSDRAAADVEAFLTDLDERSLVTGVE